MLFDVVDTVGGPDFLGEVAYWNITVGLVGGLLAAAAGAFDLLAIPDRHPRQAGGAAARRRPTSR